MVTKLLFITLTGKLEIERGIELARKTLVTFREEIADEISQKLLKWPSDLSETNQ